MLHIHKFYLLTSTSIFIGESQVAVEQTVELMPNVTLKYNLSQLDFVPRNASLGPASSNPHLLVKRPGGPG